MTMYTGDNKEYFPPNPDDGNTLPGYNWLSGDAGIGSPQEFDPDVVKDPTRSLLISYLGGKANIFRCPADQRQGLYQGINPTLAGQIVPAARTYSMSQAVGTIDPGFDATGPGSSGSHQGIPTLPVNGPHLNGQNTNRHNHPYATYGKATAVGTPGPSMLWMLLDENPKGLNDAAFAFQMVESRWGDAPGSYHGKACGFAFADGHSEIHRWLVEPQPRSAAISTDWGWMQQRTSVRVEN
jgi:prepilin-type processing-associated H-X9-DG protein